MFTNFCTLFEKKYAFTNHFFIFWFLNQMIETDKRLVEMSEELHAEMGENAEMAHSLDLLQADKSELLTSIGALEEQLVNVRGQVSSYETDNLSLHRQLEELRQENQRLQAALVSQGGKCVPGDDGDRDRLVNTISGLNAQITTLQVMNIS